MKDPLIISSIIIALCFIIILLFNNRVKSKIINYSFLIFGLIYIILIIALDSNFIYQFLKAIITYIWYPNYLIFVIAILTNIIIFMITILNKKTNKISKIINYLLFAISFACYICFLRSDIDTNLYTSLYQTNSLVLMRIITISLLIGILIKLIIKARYKYEK